MNFYRHNWYYIGGLLFVALSFIMGLSQNNFSQAQIILTYSFMAMLAHQVEEYALPGGFPSNSNIALFKEKIAPDRYPLNANQCLISNVFLTYPFYIIAIMFPNIIWLGLGQVMLGILQIFAHVIVMPIKLKKVYNPGFVTTIFLLIPTGTYYIWFVTKNNLASTGDLIGGSLTALAAGVVLFGLPIISLRSRKSKYPFSEAEMNRSPQIHFN